MNRFNNAILPTLKTKAFEETESVSKNIARRFYQAVSNSANNNSPNNNSNGANNFNIIESRTFPPPLYRPIAKSNSSPNLRSSVTSSPSPTPSPRPVPILDSSPSNSSQQQRKQAQQQQQQQLQRRALSLQDLTALPPSNDDSKFVNETLNHETTVLETVEKDHTLLGINKHRSFFAAASSVLTSQFSAALFLLPQSPSLLTRSNLVDFSLENRLENAASVVQEEAVGVTLEEDDDYVPYAIDETEFTEEEQQQILDQNNSFGKHCYHIANSNNNAINNAHDQSSNISSAFVTLVDGTNNNNNNNNNNYINNDNNTNNNFNNSTLSNTIEWCPEPDVSSLSLAEEASSEASLDNEFVQHFLDQNEQSSPNSKQRRSVSFDPMASVILIPTKEEYYAAGLEQDLWWRSWEMKQFKYSAYCEVQYIMKLHGFTHSKEAFRRMSLLQYHQDEEVAEVEEDATTSVQNKQYPHQQYHHHNNNVVFGSSLHMSRSRSVKGSLHDLAAASMTM